MEYTSRLDLNSRALLWILEEPTITDRNGATLKIPALHTEGTDIIGG